jgi:hypothetical protein
MLAVWVEQAVVYFPVVVVVVVVAAAYFPVVVVVRQSCVLPQELSRRRRADERTIVLCAEAWRGNSHTPDATKELRRDRPKKPAMKAMTQGRCPSHRDSLATRQVPSRAATSALAPRTKVHEFAERRTTHRRSARRCLDTE